MELKLRLGVCRVFNFNVDSLATLRSLSGRVFQASHALLEALDRTAQIAAHVAQFLCAKYHDDDQQHNQPMPDAE